MEGEERLWNGSSGQGELTVGHGDTDGIETEGEGPGSTEKTSSVMLG